jgi:outer membrane protein
MKNFLFAFGLLFVLNTFGQRAAFVDTDKILEQIPAYRTAQEKLNNLANQYKEEIHNMQKQLDKMMYTYQADKILLTPEMKDKREAEIELKKKELEQLKMRRFGENGDLFKERQKLIKPIQDQVYEAIKEVADRGNYTLIIDIADNPSVLYYDEKYDKTEDVLKKLGYL